MQVVISLFLAVSSLLFENKPDKPFVVIELFTSEGCSSCPPADRLLSEIVNNRYDDVEVIGLSFHVDYWDYIGWKDPYASERYTQRQRAYARKFQSRQIYTPQMVVNGKHEFVGSDEEKWNRIFAGIKDKKSPIVLFIKDISLDRNLLTLKVASNQEDKTILNVAIVERLLSQEVLRGENRGRRLKHDNVVRYFTSRQFDGEINTFTIPLPNELKIHNSSVVLYTQDDESWELISAKKLDLEAID